MIYWTLFGMAVITFLNRYAFFADAIRYQPSSKLKRFLSYSSYAVLTAIWTPIIFKLDANSGFSHAGVDYLVAASVAAVLSVIRVPSILVVVVSAIAFFGLRFYLS